MNTPKRTILFAGGLIAAGLLAVAPTRAADVSDNASDFLQDAARGNQAEIAMADIAVQKAQNPEVKQLAQMIRDNHQQAQQKLQTLAQTHGVTLKDTPGLGDRLEESRLKKTSGADFDKEYTTLMLKDHEKDINKFQKAANQITETDVKEYAQNCLSTLRKHFDHAEKAARSVGVSEETISDIAKKLPGEMGGAGERYNRGAGTGQKQP